MTVEVEGELPVRIVQKAKGTPALQIGADICVVGAGISGVSAAIEAARLGRKVILVDGLPSLGGQAVNSIIGTFCGLFSNGLGARQLTHGIADEILHDLGAQGALHYNRSPATTVVYYDEVALSRWVERTIHAAGITVVLGAVLRQVELEDRRVKELHLATRYGDLRIAATGFVDSTGDAALAWEAGLACRQPDIPIFGTQMVVLEHLDETHRPTPADFKQRSIEKAAQYGLVRTDGLAFYFPGRGTAAINMTHVETPLDPLGASQKALEGKDQADRVVAFLKAEFPATFGNAQVRAYGLPGIRQTRWIVGRHQLTTEEVRHGVRFADAIGRTAWPIELHGKPEGYKWETFAEDHLHYIPLDSLLPSDAHNLVAAGRCIDADAAALSSVRVMGPCIAMGAAAAHALDLAGSGSLHQIDMGNLSRRLSHNLDG